MSNPAERAGPVAMRVARGLSTHLEPGVAELAEIASAPIVAAYVLCLEAVHEVGRAVLVRPAVADDRTARVLHEAWAALRAASVAIRFGIVEHGDRMRQCRRAAVAGSGCTDQCVCGRRETHD